MALKRACIVVLLFCSVAVRTLSETNTQQLMKNEMCLLKKQFPSQNWRTWYTIAGALQNMLCDNPTRPTIILLVSPPSGQQTARALATCLSRSVRKLMDLDCDCGRDNIVGGDFSSLASGTDFFEEVRGAMQNDVAAVVEDVQDVNFNGALMFLTMSGQAASRYKESALVMTLSTQGYSGGQADTPKELADEYLRKTWGQTLQCDVLGAIVDRITEYAIIVIPEEQPHKRRANKKEAARCLGCETEENYEEEGEKRGKSCSKGEERGKCSSSF